MYIYAESKKLIFVVRLALTESSAVSLGDFHLVCSGYFKHEIQMYQRVMVMGISWLGKATECLLLLTVTSSLWNLPSVTSKKCNAMPIRPVVDISSNPSTHTLPIGSAINLTCKAWPTVNDAGYEDRLTEYIQWYDPQDRPVGAKCLQGTRSVLRLHCTLTIQNMTVENFGHYTCEAANYYEAHCTRKSVEIGIQGVQAPEFVGGPLNQSAVIGSNLTLNCIVTGRPKPTITWIKNNDPYAVHSNPRAKVIRVPLDDQTIHSKLLITGVKKGDYGQYLCIANNSAGKNTSVAAFLSQRDLNTRMPEIVEDPKNQTVSIGSNVTFNCTVTGRPRPTITWIKDNSSYPAQSNPRTSVMVDSVKNYSQLLITGVKKEDYGKYWCIANNNAGKKESVVAFLDAIDLVALMPDIVEGPKNQSDVIGSNVTLNCTATGRPPPTITWIKNNSYAVQSNQRVVVASSFDYKKCHSRLLIIAVRKDDEGKYQCFASNSAGEKTSTMALLHIKEETKSPTTATRTKKSSTIQMTAITVSCTVVAALICGIVGVLWYRRTKRSEKGQRERVLLANSKNGTDVAEHNTEDVPSPETKTMKNAEEELLLCTLQDDIEDREPPEGSELSSIEDVEGKRLRSFPILQRKDPGEHMFDTCTSFPSAKYCGDTVGVNSFMAHQDLAPHCDGHRDCREISQEIEEGCENDLESLEVLDEVLGEGEYGIVYRGRYGGKDGNITDVAVKKLKDTSTIAKAALFNEIRTLKKAGRHPNIVSLIGTWINGENILVVTELVRGGNLENLLTTKGKPGEWNKYANVGCKLNDRQLITIAFQIASGMQHLEERKCVHCDLAARNVFIDANLVAKVGDFGLARDISNDGIYTKTSSGKVPWRWSSLESLRDRVYTSTTDVWSFGIVLWEIATYGELPYPDISSPLTLVSWLSTGYRMPRPDQCSEELYALMSSCWKENPLMRPTFADIAQQLKYFLREVKRTYVNIKEDGITREVNV